MARLRLESQFGNLRRRSSTILSASSVLNANARVRRPGDSACVTRFAVSRRSSRSGENSRAIATSSETGSVASGSSTVIADACSSNSRVQAERPVSARSLKIRSSGSESRCGR